MIQPIILAAGKGTRMQSELPKVLNEVNGIPMLEHVLRALAMASDSVVLPPIVVIGFGAQQIRAKYSNLLYAEQKELTGTATALEAALPLVPAQAKCVLVLYGDNPFISEKTIREMVDKFVQQQSVLTWGVVMPPNFEGTFKPFEVFGRVILDELGYPARIVEFLSATEQEREDITLLNAGPFAAELSWLRKSLPLIMFEPTKGERYLTDLMQIARGGEVETELVKMELIESFGVNSKADILVLQELRIA